MNGSVLPSLREAIHHTAMRSGSMKQLAAELDWSPSQLSMATTLGEEGRPFPADDAHLVRMLRVTGDHSVLYTLAELLGYEVRPKTIDVPKLLQEVRREVQALMPKIQLLLDLNPDGNNR